MTDYNFTNKAPGDFWPKKKEWTIDWVVPSVREESKPNEVFPEAHTHGLYKFGHKELQIRLMPLESSGFILNLVASWIASEQGKIANGDTITIESFTMKVKEEKYLGHGKGEIIFRLAWGKDL